MLSADTILTRPSRRSLISRADRSNVLNSPEFSLQYLRLVLPHVGLVLASILYAVAGAFIFYAVEKRHELETKSHSIRKVTSARFDLVDNMWNNSRRFRMAKDPWLKEAEREFANWTSMLYTAFKKEFVKYQHVSTTRTFRTLPEGDGYNLTFEQDDYNVWTPSSSIFFAWTTMATIGTYLPLHS